MIPHTPAGPIGILMVLIAKETTVDTTLLQYGAIGVIAVVALAAVRVLFKRETDAYDREKNRADRLEAELAKLNQTIQERYLVALNDATRAVADALTKLSQVRRDRD